MSSGSEIEIYNSREVALPESEVVIPTVNEYLSQAFSDSRDLIAAQEEKGMLSNLDKSAASLLGDAANDGSLLHCIPGAEKMEEFLSNLSVQWPKQSSNDAYRKPPFLSYSSSPYAASFTLGPTTLGSNTGSIARCGNCILPNVLLLRFDKEKNKYAACQVVCSEKDQKDTPNSVFERYPPSSRWSSQMTFEFLPFLGAKHTLQNVRKEVDVEISFLINAGTILIKGCLLEGNWWVEESKELEKKATEAVEAEIEKRTVARFEAYIVDELKITDIVPFRKASAEFSVNYPDEYQRMKRESRDEVYASEEDKKIRDKIFHNEALKICKGCIADPEKRRKIYETNEQGDSAEVGSVPVLYVRHNMYVGYESDRNKEYLRSVDYVMDPDEQLISTDGVVEFNKQKHKDELIKRYPNPLRMQFWDKTPVPMESNVFRFEDGTFLKVPCFDFHELDLCDEAVFDPATKKTIHRKQIVVGRVIPLCVMPRVQIDVKKKEPGISLSLKNMLILGKFKQESRNVLSEGGVHDLRPLFMREPQFSALTNGNENGGQSSSVSSDEYRDLNESPDKARARLFDDLDDDGDECSNPPVASSTKKSGGKRRKTADTH